MSTITSSVWVNRCTGPSTSASERPSTERPSGRREHLVEENGPLGGDVCLRSVSEERVALGRGIQAQGLEPGMRAGDGSHQDAIGVVPDRQDRSRGDEALVRRGPQVVGVDLPYQQALGPRGTGDHAADHVHATRTGHHVSRHEQRQTLGQVGAVVRTHGRDVGQSAYQGDAASIATDVRERGEPPRGGRVQRRRALRGRAPQGIGERWAGGDVLEGGVHHEEPLEDRGAERLAGLMETGLALSDEVPRDLAVRQGRDHSRREDGRAHEEQQQAATEPALQRPGVARRIHGAQR